MTANQPKIEQNSYLTSMAIRVMMGLSRFTSSVSVGAFFIAQNLTKYITRGQFVALESCRIISTPMAATVMVNVTLYARFKATHWPFLIPAN